MLLKTQKFDIDPEQLLLERLQEHGLLTIVGLSVRVREGIAYISGYVPNVKQKKLVTEIARQIQGIYKVINMLRITPLAILDDPLLEESVRQALSKNGKLTGSRITVRVTNGHVYLSGFVTTAAEKSLAEREVWGVPGIKDITSDIQILSEMPKSETEVAEEILLGLRECLGLDIAAIKIDFQDGIVRMHGTVPTEYARETAEEIAMWTPQVRAVINELRIGYPDDPDKKQLADPANDPEFEHSLHNLAIS